jgi:hypothetical protein
VSCKYTPRSSVHQGRSLLSAFITLNTAPAMADDLEDLDAERQIASAELFRLRSTHANAAYRDAVSDAREAVLQESFGAGFLEGARTAQPWGELQGMCSALKEIAHAQGKVEEEQRIDALLSRLQSSTPLAFEPAHLSETRREAEIILASLQTRGAE